MESLKGQVVRSFLELVSRYLPLKEAQLATLGGHGLEAKIWSELGIPDGNGWLIERNRKLSAKLIGGHRYRTQNQLGTFDQILAGHGEDHAFVDGFHLDLCGTFSNSTIANFAPALPLVLKSKGRCLAITIADARRNPALEKWPDFQRRAKKIFGSQTENIFEDILYQQRLIPTRKNTRAFIKPFDPEKGAKREFGLLVELTELLKIRGFPWIPVIVERYVYVSRYKERPFRMRTYFFRFEFKPGGRKGEELAFARVWTKSPLFFANGDDFIEVKSAIDATPIVQKTEKVVKGEVAMTPQTSKLATLASMVGGDVLIEYNDLLLKSQRLDTIIESLKGVVGEVNVDEVVEKETPAPTQESSIAETEPTKTAEPALGKPLKRRKWEDLDAREQVTWALKTLELKKSQGGKWKNGTWEKLLKKDFGYYKPALGSSLRAVLSRTSGGFRRMFAVRIRKAFGPEAKPYLDRLANL
ncbi:MAG: hypothetical protein A3A96_01925 [Candidatus Zambryskibacteria bacterium RIFCSPLOWO2_01_FULL_39_39]|uniref:Uncharacterized protein n=1 Tax=Candidatus Zambryskibacteria bacterium RIFCSPLOWO2_01_FULL_39_39 TaxID=1802758 RepID=A0A1G2TXT6_9BACT|nr:MAG: hypothetical protein UT00_C0005G0032 [Parcubacteria group bacterium GW2011_GWA1_38_7]OHA86609.1 MAG: hypothetical protein A2644_02040 [Candidatus Zambryskibacteria bacterium RIFCSPHIGHO2_01_FULL_39_63]OHA94222.1 MAG: hypothetical protein A3B88_03675 [Candidatus Zambryskibacteria bacterium RIFCSPHIGHO2_02_FULL_39_19]OHA98511.1 MAG: hypothetical protein A3F20_03820 [Candidatus Zambryskibacteria bacterium RIFCSPHIGHO2_12_FULL_39_21]OHB01430.1 MAG: hypothetical protein A3A96_01925 [Candidat